VVTGAGATTTHYAHRPDLNPCVFDSVQPTVHNVAMPDEFNGSFAPTRAGSVANELRRLIRSGELPAGTRLRQVDIADRFNVSTTPVREAFTSLAREGLVRQDAHRGVVVFVPSADDLEQNYELRIALEPLAAKIAATNITPEEIALLDQLLKEMRKAMRGDLSRYGSELNPRFHASIYDAARRPRLAEMISQLRDAAAAYTQLLSLKPQPKSYVQTAQDEHEEIVDALRARAPKRVSDAMTKHLSRNRDQILASLQPSGD
jgi:DNA-binding GntR family transcriptional regulator